MKIDRSKFLAVCLSLVPVAVIACGGSGDDTSAGGSDLSASGGPAATTAPSASAAPSASNAPGKPAADAVVVNTTPLSVKTADCTVDIKAPTVSIPSNKAAEDAINKVLAPLAASPCDEGGVDVESTFEVTANANGLLSILVTGSSFFTGAAHPNGGANGFNFDVKTGKQLQLADVLTADGIAKELAGCIASDPNADPGAPATEGGIGVDDCNFAIKPDPQDGIEPGWVARPTGLELEVGTDHADGDVRPSLVAWKDLVTTGMNASVAQDYAKAQK